MHNGHDLPFSSDLDCERLSKLCTFLQRWFHNIESSLSKSAMDSAACFNVEKDK